MKKSTLLHLRIPFSFFLLPVFLFAWAIAPQVEASKFWIAFVVIHIFLYPASNAYNSYFDKDEGSIGGLKKPPLVSQELYYYSILLDAIAVIVGWLAINWQFGLMLFIAGWVSKAYSHPSVRLKKMAWLSWLTAGFFQGYFTFIMSYLALHDTTLSSTFTPFIQLPALLSTAMLMGSYPMTQIYQHEEDSKRGDLTLSIKLGVLGTFHFTALAFSISTAGFFLYFFHYFSWQTALIHVMCLTPVLLFFGYWYWKVRKDPSNADFEHTMRLNLVSSIMLNLFFLSLGILL
ncbi:MAG: UbiA family prenyltransferase [Saprospiraceae bacterium]|nr:UbiA family prenyltransferase [Saprospiraceae bacterium]